jgi:hypothetical protein
MPKKLPSSKKEESDTIGGKTVTFDPIIQVKHVEAESITKHVNVFG